MPPSDASPEGMRCPVTKASFKCTRCDAVHKCASIPYLIFLFFFLLLLILLLFFFSIELQRAKRNPNFILFYQNDVVLGLFKNGQNDVILDFFILKNTGQNDVIFDIPFRDLGIFFSLFCIFFSFLSHNSHWHLK